MLELEKTGEKMNSIYSEIYRHYHNKVHGKINKEIEIKKKNKRFYFKIRFVQTSSIYYKMHKQIYDIRNTILDSFLGGG